jgi:hypothetical protein
VCKIEDPVLLARIATTDPEGRVREAAVENQNLTDRALLSGIALDDADDDVRQAAVKKTEDQAVLVRIATTAAEKRVRWAAVEKIEDPAVLVRVATSDEFCEVREAAVRKLRDEQMLAEVARNNSMGAVREAAVKNPYLTDRATFAYIARNDQLPGVCGMAARRLQNGPQFRLRCTYCHSLNTASSWPARGDSVPFYYQSEEAVTERPGAYREWVHCPQCRQDWYVVWDQDPR